MDWSNACKCRGGGGIIQDEGLIGWAYVILCLQTKMLLDIVSQRR